MGSFKFLGKNNLSLGQKLPDAHMNLVVRGSKIEKGKQLTMMKGEKYFKDYFGKSIINWRCVVKTCKSKVCTCTNSGKSFSEKLVLKEKPLTMYTTALQN